MEINAIDTHCHIHYTPVETLASVSISDVMQEGNFYTAYWDMLSQMEKAAKSILTHHRAHEIDSDLLSIKDIITLIDEI